MACGAGRKADVELDGEEEEEEEREAATEAGRLGMDLGV